jgi:DNA primase
MKSTLEELLEKADIIEIISQYVTLRRQGRNYVGICPFHKEKTPSFTVSPEKQIYYCFGCHQGGNVVNFLMKHEGLSFQEALENLGEKYGVKIRRADQKRLNLYGALSKLSDHYHETLKSSRYALDYLLKRGITDTAIEEFRIGYSDRLQDSIKAFLKGSGIPLTGSCL